ncbi:inorganic pyrophosphatase-like isoform X1 [Penaeus chinensis]|uniref:inorganic pyrophosphatase-like isoform X1 n=1 Tax=Penaeus chinensis TaxID=139456 RepID=UPI001FB671FE|nr:inorganic pyrophosphatase-like isoform X1 [Penaeus chinensis]
MQRLLPWFALASVLCMGRAGVFFTPSVKNNITLLMPDGVLVPLWPGTPPGPPVSHRWSHLPLSYPFLDGFKVRVTTTVGGGDDDDDSQEDEDSSREAMAEAPAGGTEPEVTPLPSSSSKPCCQGTSASGSSAPGDHLNSLDFYPVQRLPRPPLVVWPESTSQYRPLNVSIKETGIPNSHNYKIYFQNEDGPVSPFHDIPLFANEGNKIFNMVVEVPRWTNAKMEISTKEYLNPIKQDVKKGKLRYVANCFPHHGYIWNYGALPQTWEDPNHIDEATSCKGDNDPIDVCEIGYRVAKRGDVIQVKVLGTLALIDEGETDWKLIAIDVNDPLAPQLSDISDVEKHMPGFLKATVEWFRIYKIPDGKPENQFAFNGEAKDREFAHKIILETHEAWKNLVEGNSDAGGLDIGSVMVPQAAKKLPVNEAQSTIDGAPEVGQPQPVDPKTDTWHYVSLK